MKNLIVVSIIIVIGVYRSRAAFEHLSHGSSTIALGGAASAMRNNPWAAFCNPGSLATLEVRMLSLYYAPQPFGLKELAHGSFSYVEPLTFGTLGASGSRYGFDLYREVDLHLSYGREINGLFSFGGSVHYYHLSIERYGSASTFGVDVGLLARFSDQVRWGFTAFNVNGPSIGSSREKLPQVFVMGGAYSPIPEAELIADLEKDIRYPVQLHVGVQYSPLDVLALRAGTNSEPSVLCAGVGIHYSLIQLDYAFTNHADLGVTHHVSLSLYLGEH